MRKAALVLGAVAAVACIVLILRLDRGRDVAALAAPEATPSSGEVAPSVRAADADARDPVLGASDEAPLVVKSDGAALPKRAPSQLSGTVVVTDPDGVEHATEDGRLGLMLWNRRTGKHAWIDVEDGHWSTEIVDRSVDAVEVNYVSLGGRLAAGADDSEERIPLPANGWLELRARWPAPSILHVRDRESGRELDRVRLVDAPNALVSHPGADALAARSLGPSPVTVEAKNHGLLAERTVFHGLLPERTLFVRGEDHAWGQITIDETRGGERIVLLDPGGELEITVAGVVDDPGASLRLYRERLRPFFASDVPEASALVDGLPPGRYRVAVQIGELWDQPVVLGDTTAEVVAGTRTAVVVPVRPPLPRVDVAVSGTLFVPPEWALDAFTLDFELQDVPLGGGERQHSIESSRMERTGDPPRQRWSLPSVQTGRYEAVLNEVGFRTTLEVSPDGLQDVHLEVPPPAELRVRCIDTDTGLEAEGVRVWWRTAESGISLDTGSSDGNWRVPVGEVWISADGDGYGSIEERVSVKPGSNDVVLEVERQASLRIVLRDGSTEIPWSDASAHLEPAEGQEEKQAFSLSKAAGTLTLHRTVPGLYELSVSNIDGYEPVPVALVRLEKGVVTEHVVELRQKR